MFDRRHWLRLAVAGSSALMLPGAAFASATRPRLIVLQLRGGLDGLAAVVPYGDPQYASARGALALPRPGVVGGVIAIDDLFGLHPSLETLAGLFASGEAAAIHAVATPYRERSHFDAQKVLENGVSEPGTPSGWLNRLVQVQPALGALAVGAAVPLVLRGDAPIESWSPSRLPAIDDSVLARLADLYRSDPFLATRLDSALGTRETVDMQPDPGRGPAALAEPVAALMRRDDGPDVVAIGSGGWDTHANQGSSSGQLANRLAGLDAGIAAFRRELGPLWSRTLILVVTEFGRTVAPNGTGGTDHGTASVALLAGGAVGRAAVFGKWPGLAARARFEGRDLQPTTDLRAVYRAVLAGHFGVREARALDTVLPGSATAGASLAGLLDA